MNEAYLLRIASEQPVRVWSGNGDLEVPACPFEPDGGIYEGMGELAGLPAVQALINGIAQRVEFVVSGVSANIISLVLEDRDSLYQAEALIGSVVMDADLQLVGVVNREWKGICDTITTTSEPGGQGRTRSVSISVGSGDMARSRAKYAFFTDSDQRRRPGSEDDSFFSNVASITAGDTRRFGPK